MNQTKIKLFINLLIIYKLKINDYEEILYSYRSRSFGC